MIKHFVAQAYFYKIALFNFCGFALLLIGCSSTYTIKDFSSKEKFYEDFNNSAKDKTVKVTLTNDSSFTTLNGASISNDSLIFISQIKKEKIIIEPGEITNIKYYGIDMSNLSALILLKNGEEIKAENVSLISDSSINATVKKTIYEFIPLKNVREVSYKNHWLGVPIRLFNGTVGGFVIGLISSHVFVNQNEQSDAAIYVGWGITAIGLVAGGIWGWIEGYNYTYQFNP